MLSHWLGWICTAILLSEFFTLLARKYRLQQLNHFRHQHHIVWGKLLLLLSLLHALLSPYTLSLPLLSGILLILLLLLLLLTYHYRTALGKHWLSLHRLSAFLLLPLLLFHILLSVGA